MRSTHEIPGRRFSVVSAHNTDLQGTPQVYLPSVVRLSASVLRDCLMGHGGAPEIGRSAPNAISTSLRKLN